MPNTEAIVAVYEHQLERLASLAQQVGTAPDLVTIFRALNRFVLDAMPASGLFASLYDPERRLRTCVYATSEGEELDVSALPPMPMTNSPHSRAVATGQVIVIDDLAAALIGLPSVMVGRHIDPSEPQSAVAVPMIVMDRVIGGFEVQSTRLAAFSDAHIVPLRMAANLAAIAIENVQLLERERKQRMAVEMSEQRFRLLVEGVKDYALVMFDAAGCVASWNVGAERIHGFSAADILGAPISRFYMTEDIEQGKPEHTLQAVAAEGRWEGQGWRVRKDGSRFWADEVITSLSNDSGALHGFVSLTRDITERKQAEEALRTAYAEMEARVRQRTAELHHANEQLRGEVREREHAELLARQAQLAAEQANHAKSEFLSRMSHELRTPLNAILGFGQVLEMGKLTTEDRESVDHILKGGRHLLELINEVLDIARIEAGHLSLSIDPVAVHELIGASLDLLQPLAAKRAIRLVHDGSAVGNRTVLADRQRLKQVFLNLVSNAVKYNRPGGSVHLTTVPCGPALLRIEVRDTGPGITPDNITKLFTPFERLGAERSGVEGTGIGLALSRRLVEAMGGAIGVESVVGHGSTFWVELPLVDAPVASSAPRGQERQGLARAPALARRVLYIEDNLSNLQLIEHILADQPQFHLLSAMQGGLGLELAREHHPDLILLDLHLPDIAGDAVLERLQADPAMRDIPVIMLSADATPRQIERLLAAGARAYLTKPLDVRQFLSVLDEALSQQS